MKNFLKKILKKVINFIKWIWNECKDWRTLVLLILVCIVMYSPVWVMGIIAFVFDAAWAGAAATAVAGFWLAPFTPFFPLAISITFGIKKLFQKKEQIAEKVDEIKTHHKEHKKERKKKYEKYKKEKLREKDTE